MKAEQLEELMRVLEMYAHDEGRARIVAALGTVLDLHREAFRRMLDLARLTGHQTLVREFRADPLLREMLDGYGLDEADLPTRVHAALELARPLLVQHRAHAVMIGLAGTQVRLRLFCPARVTAPVRSALKDELGAVIRKEVPELAEVIIVDPVDPGVLAAPERWAPLAYRHELQPQDPLKVQFFDDQLLAYAVGDEVVVIRNRCPAGDGDLEDSRRAGPVITCRCHGYRFDLRGGNCIERGDLKLALLPATVEEGTIRVGL